MLEQQYIQGNCKMIYDHFPTIEHIYSYTFPYTFFNRGPHSNILETASIYFSDYEVVILSTGAYSNILANEFNRMNKQSETNYWNTNE